MKKVVVATLVLASLSKAANAQTGSILVGGNIDFQSVKSPATPNTIKTRQFTFIPTVGYQIDNNWTAGVVADIETFKNNNSVSASTKSSRTSVGPFVRYAKSLSNTFAVYGQVQGLFGNTRLDGSKQSSFSDVSAFPALFINFKKGFGLNFSVGGIE